MSGFAQKRRHGKIIEENYDWRTQKMCDFFKFLKQQGVPNPEEIMTFVTSFLNDPGVINDLSQAELQDIEKKLDLALTPFILGPESM
jgi:hypothetical protein